MKVLNVWDKSVEVVNGHYQLDIPFKEDTPNMPDDRQMAEKRLQHLIRRMKKEPTFGERYAAGIKDYIDQGYAEECDGAGIPGQIWYIPHHAVFSAKKPDKLRIVFDCSATFQGTCINDQIHQGPDFTNKLIGVLLRFRERPIAIVADVQAMYHQVRVTPAHRDALRFLSVDGDKTTTFRTPIFG